MTSEQNKSPPRYTPEPWLYDPESGVIHSLDGTLICDVCRDPCSEETAEHDANGFLIVVAPSLLEGGEAAVAAFDILQPLLPEGLLQAEVRRLWMAIEGLRYSIGLARRGQDRSRWN